MNRILFVEMWKKNDMEKRKEIEIKIKKKITWKSVCAWDYLKIYTSQTRQEKGEVTAAIRK